MDIWDQIILCCGKRRGCPVHGRMFNNIPGLYSVDTSSNPLQVVTTRLALGYCQNIPWGGRITHKDTRKWKKLKKKIFPAMTFSFTKQQRKGPWVWAAVQVKDWTFHHLETSSICLTLGLFWRQQTDKRCSSSSFLGILTPVKYQWTSLLSFLLTLERSESYLASFFFLPWLETWTNLWKYKVLTRMVSALGFGISMIRWVG